jgi:hypothetical protein
VAKVTRAPPIQGAIIELLEGGGIQDIAACCATEQTMHKTLGEILADAVTMARARRRRPQQERVPSWAEGADPVHVHEGPLPDLRRELAGRMEVRCRSFIHPDKYAAW